MTLEKCTRSQETFQSQNFSVSLTSLQSSLLPPHASALHIPKPKIVAALSTYFHFSRPHGTERGNFIKALRCAPPALAALRGLDKAPLCAPVSAPLWEKRKKKMGGGDTSNSNSKTLYSLRCCARDRGRKGHQKAKRRKKYAANIRSNGSLKTSASARHFQTRRPRRGSPRPRQESSRRREQGQEEKREKCMKTKDFS